MQQVSIVMLMSLPNSDTLSEWQRTILKAISEFSTNKFIIVAPYEYDKCQIAIDLFTENDKYHSFLQIHKFDTQNKIAEGVESFIKWIDDEIGMSKIEAFATCFNPCMGNREELIDSILSQINSSLENPDAIFLDDTKHFIKSCSFIQEFAMRTIDHWHIDWHHLMNDPAEIRLDDFAAVRVKTHFIHDIQSIDSIVVNPFIVYSFQEKLLELQSSHVKGLLEIHKNKKFSFVFGLTAFNDERKHIVNSIIESKLISKKRKFYYYLPSNNNVASIDTRIDYNEYLDEVNNSRSTLVVPAYEDKITFSVHRFVESIAQCCIPIIYKANYKAAFGNDEQMCNLIEKYLYVDDISKLNDKIENIDNDWLFIITELIHTNYIKSLSNKSTYQYAE